MDLNHRSLAYETSGDDRTPPLRCVYLSSVTPGQLMVNAFWINWRKTEESNPIPVKRTWFSRPVAGPSPLHHLPCVVRLTGIEPVRPYGHQILSLRRLPITPQSRVCCPITVFMIYLQVVQIVANIFLCCFYIVMMTISGMV